jgi:flagellar assembly protein FliH
VPEPEAVPHATPADTGEVGAETAAATLAPATALTLDDDELAGLLAGAAVEARAAAAAEVQQRLAEAEATLAEAFGREVAARERARGETAELILALVRTIAEHVVTRAVAAAPLDDLGRELPTLLARLEAPEEVTVAVHPDLAEDLQARLAALAAQAGFAGTVTAEADAALVPGDAVVRWPGGTAGRHLATRIDEAVRLAAGWLAERDTTERAEAPAATTTTEGSDEH